MNKLNIKTVDEYIAEELGDFVCPVPWEKTIFYADRKFITSVCNFFNRSNKTYIKTNSVQEIVDCDNYKNAQSAALKHDYSNCFECEAYKNKKAIFTNFNSVKTKISINIGSECNLRCLTCRDEFMPGHSLTNEQLQSVIDAIKMHEQCVIGGGELFFDKLNLEILSSDLSNSKLKEIILFTNGTVVNEQTWKKIHPNNLALIKEVFVSIDAATPETYEYVRKGGKWNDLVEGVKFLKKKSNEYKFTLSSMFIISKYNYHEAADFLDFAENVKLDKIEYDFARPQLENKENDKFILSEKEKDDIKWIVNSAYHKKIYNVRILFYK